MRCPICNSKIKIEYSTGDFDRDMAMKLLNHCRHTHTDYEKLFTKESKISKIKTTSYSLIKDQYNKQIVSNLSQMIKEPAILNVLLKEVK